MLFKFLIFKNTKHKINASCKKVTKFQSFGIALHTIRNFGCLKHDRQKLIHQQKTQPRLNQLRWDMMNSCSSRRISCIFSSGSERPIFWH
uniref:Uncharacterized protein n=1 Tax=Arundo donax TaxID=35708 RepID=A0A0A9DBZ4_ARUDO